MCGGFCSTPLPYEPVLRAKPPSRAVYRWFMLKTALEGGLPAPEQAHGARGGGKRGPRGPFSLLSALFGPFPVTCGFSPGPLPYEPVLRALTASRPLISYFMPDLTEKQARRACTEARTGSQGKGRMEKTPRGVFSALPGGKGCHLAVFRPSLALWASSERR